MTAQQPPGAVEFLFAEQPQGGQGHRQLDRAGAGQRPEVTEPQPGRGRLGDGEPVTAGDQQPAPVRRVGPAGQELDEGRVTDGARASRQRQIVVEVVEHEEQRHLIEDVPAQQPEALGPGQLGPVCRRHRFRRAAAPGRRLGVPAQGGGDPGEKRIGGHLAVEDRGHVVRFEPAHPLGDLGGERRFADPADAVQHEPGHGRARELRGPAPALGRADRERRRSGRSSPAVLACRA